MAHELVSSVVIYFVTSSNCQFTPSQITYTSSSSSDYLVLESSSGNMNLYSSSSSSSSTSGGSAPDDATGGGSNVGPAVGGAVGGVLVIGIIVGVVVWWHRSRNEATAFSTSYQPQLSVPFHPATDSSIIEGSELSVQQATV